MRQMEISIVHGYFLGDSGSAIYVRELAREFVRQGHSVTLVCQEPDGRDHDFIDSFHQLDATNTRIETIFERDTAYPGRCRLVRPDLGGSLLTYVPGPFSGYEAIPFQEADEERIAACVDRNTRALETVFSRWPPEFVQANHLVMQPFIARKALAGRAPYCVTIHGSALNFTVKQDERMVPYALEGLDGAAYIAALSETSCSDVVDFAAGHGLDVGGRTHRVPPGVDSGLMRPLPESGRQQAMREISPDLDPARDELGVFVGRLLWTKGLHYAVAALPLILESHPDFHIVAVGEGPMEQPLRDLIGLLDGGLLAEARALVAGSLELRAGDGFGPVIPDLAPEAAAAYIGSARGRIRNRVHFTGHLTHPRLAPIYGAADISLAPSVFPEAFALVSIEALSAGALPLVTYQSGLRSAADAVVGELEDDSFRQLAPGSGLACELARTAVALLDRYPTRDQAFRQRLHQVVRKAYSWSMVSSRYLSLLETGDSSL